MKFENWLAKTLNADASEIQKLLNDITALHFLLTWSLFESKCFAGFMKKDQVLTFSHNAANSETFNLESVLNFARKFHKRYQNEKHYQDLLYNDKCEEMDNIVRKDFAKLSSTDSVFLVIFTVYRYRNNIFHGNKGVESWLRYEKQIEWCTEVMQTIINWKLQKT